jgi:hypothetical protein
VVACFSRQTRIAATIAGSLFNQTKNSESRPMTVIEIKPHRWGWKVFEAPSVEPVFPEKR